MSKSEKRHFKLSGNVQLNKSPKAYIKLFDVLEAQKEFNEALISKKLIDKDLSVNYQITKNYLKNALLKSLRIFHGHNSVTSILRSLLNEIEITLNRGQYAIGYGLIDKAKKIAYEYELFQYLIEIFDYEKLILNNKKYIINLKEIIQEEKNVIENLDNINNYKNLYYTLADFFTKVGVARKRTQLEAAKTIMKNPLLKNYKNIKLFRSKLYYLYTHALYNSIVGNNKMNVYWGGSIALFDSKPKMKLLLHAGYEAVLVKYISVSIDSRNIKEANLTTKKLEEHLKTYRIRNIRVPLHKIFAIKLKLCIIAGDFSGGLDLIDKNKPLSIILDQDKRNDIMIRLHLCIVYIASNKFEDALDWSEDILNDAFFENSRQDLQTLARIFNLIVHFELKNYLLLPSLIRNTRNFLETRGYLFDFEKKFLVILNKILQMKPDDNIKDIFKFIMAKMESINDPLERQFIEEWELLSWLESKISNRSFAEIIKSKKHKA